MHTWSLIEPSGHQAGVTQEGGSCAPGLGGLTVWPGWEDGFSQTQEACLATAVTPEL